MVKITNVGSDGRTFEDLKAEGNAAFQSRDYAAAIALYTESLTLLDIDDVCEIRSLLTSNRAACHINLKNWHDAVVDSATAISLNPLNVKAYHRKATAEQNMGDSSSAAATLRQGISSIGTADSEPLSTFLSKLVRKDTAVPKMAGAGFLLKQSLFSEGCGLSPTPGDRVLARLKEAVSFGTGRSALVDGVFQKLLDKHEFGRLVFPGLSEDQRQGMPRSFRELLDTPLYAAALEAEAVPEALAKARTVLENVKRRGAAEGDVMDESTEAHLWPQARVSLL